jgi:hypothetical protein
MAKTYFPGADADAEPNPTGATDDAPDYAHPKFPFAYPRPTVQEILMMGGLLLALKDQVGHGKFIEWVKAECPFSYRTAHRYMSVARLFMKSDTVADLTAT